MTNRNKNPTSKFTASLFKTITVPLHGIYLIKKTITLFIFFNKIRVNISEIYKNSQTKETVYWTFLHGNVWQNIIAKIYLNR